MKEDGLKAVDGIYFSLSLVCYLLCETSLVIVNISCFEDESKVTMHAIEMTIIVVDTKNYCCDRCAHRKVC